MKPKNWYTFIDVLRSFSLLSVLLFWCNSNLFAQPSINGKVIDTNGNPIGFVTIYCKSPQAGTNSNADGTFKLQLPEGNHEVYFQCVGYQTKVLNLASSQQANSIDVRLAEQTYSLKEVNVQLGGVNPAVWIMRKAIAAAPYYRRQVLKYTSTVYVKGSGTLEKVPFVFKKLLEEEGFTEGQTFLVESINELSFSQPNTYKEKAISIKSSLPQEGAPEPIRMIRGSLYNTDRTELISPLSPQAFSVYNFTLEGSFYENGREVNRIRVTPKRKGKDVFTGYVYIMEKLWCLHSTDLTVNDGQFTTTIVTSFRPVEGFDYVWMPVTYDIKAKGGFLGFKGSFRYLASVSDYNVMLNPLLDHSWLQKGNIIPQTQGEVIEPKAVQPTPVKTKRQTQIDELLAKDSLTKMEMLKLASKMKAEAESEVRQTKEIPTDSSEMIVDSLATQRDISFWEANRPVPLMESEVSSYRQYDSIQANAKPDTASKKPTKYGWIGGVLQGDSGVLASSKLRYGWSGIGPGSEIFVNTVDGWGASVRWSIGNNRTDGKDWLFSNRIRVPFERKAVNTFALFSCTYAPASFGQVKLEGGSYVSDFNPTGGAAQFEQSLLLVFAHRNPAKLFQQDYLSITHQYELANGLVWELSMGYYHRYALSNTSRYQKQESIEDYHITPNEPLPNDVFPTHNAVLLTNKFAYTPFVYYKMIRGKKVYQPSNWPTLAFNSWNGLSGIAGSNVDYMRVQLSATEKIQPLHWLQLQSMVSHQFFVYNNQSYLPDANHVFGNESPVFSGNAFNRFRQLDYYAYANTQWLTMWLNEIECKRIVLKRLPYVNMLTIKEAVFYNSLFTPTIHYQELGYSLTNLLGVGRLDVFAGFTNSSYSNWGVRLSVSLAQFN
ncbi:MAG: DUF5686 and carboxypeptidase regulatory-like domain-containing protein [Bacteroidia bacterium]|nr:DUF5686 and carboxypeptidase regulatory-like domain-containing protein [Bacteroidia bacterium]